LQHRRQYCQCGERRSRGGEVRHNVMTPAPSHRELQISREGTETRSTRIGTSPGLTLGPSLFSREKWVTRLVSGCRVTASVLRTNSFV
jgi:hypothetical protein